ncbi:SIR2 family protein [Amycolatopsis sp. NPDC004169]|uniref:SIR2 family protein n=1 Tax=Amycolatopsis sp. NPDC004169 TaxID=3154453 RepID=UPI0033B55283
MVNHDRPPHRDPGIGFFDEADTKAAIRKIAGAHRLTIFTGAGIAADLHVPNWSKLVSRLLENLESRSYRDDQECRDTVHQAVDFFHQMPAASIVDALYEERFPGHANEQRNKDIARILYAGRTSDHEAVPEDSLAVYVLRLAIAKRLAGCDIHILTTNYDDMLEQIANHDVTFSDLHLNGVEVYTNWDPDDNPASGVPISHLHGFIPRTGTARSVVFSESEYIKWDRESTWRDYLAQRVTGEGLMLFVGASLRDYNIAAMIRRFSKGEVYALLPVEDEVADAQSRRKPWSPRSARYATLRGLHLGVKVLRPDFYGQVCQFLNEATIPADSRIPDYSTRLRKWWTSWSAQEHEPQGLEYLITCSKALRQFAFDEEQQLDRAPYVKAEVWVRHNPDSRRLSLYASSQSVVLPGEGYWPHSAKIEHLSRYAAVSAFAARQATQGTVEYRTDGRWTHFLAVPVILPEAPYYELPVGVVILLLHAPDVQDDVYFGEADSERMLDLSVRMKTLGQNFLRPITSP